MNGPDSKIEVLPHSGHFLAVSRTFCEILGFPVSVSCLLPIVLMGSGTDVHPLLLIVEVATFIDEIKILASEVDS